MAPTSDSSDTSAAATVTKCPGMQELQSGHLI